MFLTSLIFASKCNQNLYQNEIYKEKLEKLEKLTKQQDVNPSVQNILKNSLHKIKKNPKISDLKPTIIFLQSILKKRDFRYIQNFFVTLTPSEPFEENNCFSLLNLNSTEINYLTSIKINKVKYENKNSEQLQDDIIELEAKITSSSQDSPVISIIDSEYNNNSFIIENKSPKISNHSKNNSFSDFSPLISQLNNSFSIEINQSNESFKKEKNKHKKKAIKKCNKKTIDELIIKESNANEELIRFKNELHILREIFNLYIYCFAYKSLYQIIKENKSKSQKILNPLRELLKTNDTNLKNMILNYNKFTYQELKNANLTMKSLKIENNDILVDILTLIQVLFYKPTIKK